MLGDTGSRGQPGRTSAYQHLVGKTLILPLVGREMPDRGRRLCRHGLRHRLRQDHALRTTRTTSRSACATICRADPHHRTTTPRINETAASTTAWTATRRARPLWPIWRSSGYLVKIEPYNHNVGTCYRCGTTVEPMTSSKQWFVKMKPLAEARHRGRARRAASSSCPSASARPIITGWRMSTTGASPASSGGATRSRRGTATTAAMSPSRAHDACQLRELRQQEHPPATPTCSIPGSAPHSGRFPRSAGRIRIPRI